MKKIVHICQSSIGGTVEYLRLFLDNIPLSNYTNILICPSSGTMKEELNNKVEKLYTIEMQREIKLFKDFKDVLEIRKILKNEKPDILYLHSSKAGALGRVAAIGLKSFKVYNPHGWAFTIECSTKKKKVYSLIERILYTFTDKIINISQDEFNQALKYGIKEEKMVLIENGIDSNRFINNNKEKFLDRTVVGFVGRLSEQKNPLFLVEIAKELKSKIPNILFYIVGDGELKETLLDMINKNDLKDNFYFAGWTNKVENEIKNFDLALMISKWEGFGLVVCEYMAAEKPVVAFPVGGVKNIILDRENGIITNSESIIKDIEELIENKSLKNKLIINAKKDVKDKYSIDNVIQKHRVLFGEKI